MNRKIFLDGVRYLSAADAAERSGLVRNYVSRLCKEGKLAGRLIDNNWYVSWDSLHAYIAEQDAARKARSIKLAKQRALEYRELCKMPDLPLTLPRQSVATLPQMAVALSLAALFSIGAYAFVDDQFGRSILALPGRTFTLVHRDQLASAAADPAGVFSGFARTISHGIDSLVYSITFSGVPDQSAQIVRWPTKAVVTTIPATSTVIHTIQTERIVTTTGGLSESLLNAKLAQLDAKLSAQILGVASLALKSTAPVVYNSFHDSGRIRRLDDARITDSSFADGSITGSSISATSLEVTGSGTSTFANGIEVGDGCVSVNGTCLGTGGGGSVTLAGSDSQVQFNDNGSLGASPDFTFSSSTGRLTVTNASSTALSSSALWLTGQSGNTLLSLDANKQLVSTSSIGTNLLTGTLGTINGTPLSVGGSITIATASSTLHTDNNTFSGNNAFIGNTTLGNATATTFAVTGTASSSDLVVSNSFTFKNVTGFLKATAGVVATSLVNLTTDITGILGVGNGGTGWSNVTSGAILYGNGSGALATTSTAGSDAGKVLTLLNGVPTWVATSTLSTISGTLGIANGGTNATSFGTTNGITYYDNTRLVTNAALTFNGNLFTTTNASTTNFSANAAWLTGQSGNTLLSLDANKQLVSTSSIGTNLLTGALGTINGTSLSAGGSITITAASSTLLANNNTWTGLNIFANSSSTLSTFGTTWLTSVTNTLLSTDQNGKIVATSSIGTNLLTGALGTVNGTSLSAGGSITITAASSTLLANNNTWTGLNIFSNASSTLLTVSGTAYFATASTTNLTVSGAPSGLLVTNSTGVVSASTTLGLNFGGTGAGTAAGARTNLAAAASGANSDITSLAGLTTALSIGQGGTGTTTWQANSIPYFNGTRFTESNTLLSFDGTKLLATNASTTALSVSGNAYFPGSGIWNSSGNVGIGTLSPTAYKLQVTNTSAGVNDLAGVEYGTATNDAGGFAFHTASTKTGAIRQQRVAAGDYSLRFLNWSGAALTEYMTIRTGGNVGIGTTTPQSLLSVQGGASPTLTLTSDSATGDAGTPAIILATALNATKRYTIQRNASTGFLDFKGGESSASGYTFNVNNGTEVVRISNAGYLGIGTTSPAYMLDVGLFGSTGSIMARGRINENASDKGVQIGYGPSDDSPRFWLGNGSSTQNWQIDNNAGTMRFFTPGVVRMAMTSTGNVGVNATPSFRLHVNGSIGFQGISVLGSETLVPLCYNTSTFEVKRSTAVNTCDGADGDIAEYYGTEGEVLRGEIVMLGTTVASRQYLIKNPSPAETALAPYTINTAKVRRATSEDRDRIIGAVPTAPFTIGSDEIAAKDHPEQVALVGHVPIKMTLDGGNIEIGDPITVSESRAGWGMKAVSTGKIIGWALEPFSKNSTSEDGMIEVYIKPQDWISPADYELLAEVATLFKTEENSAAHSHDTFFSNLFARFTQWFASAANGIGDFFAQRVRTKELCVSDTSGETCVTRAQLDSLIAGAANSGGGGGGSPPPAPSPEPTPEPSPAPTPSPEPNPESEPSPAPVPEVGPEPASEAAPDDDSASGAVSGSETSVQEPDAKPSAPESGEQGAEI